MGWSAGLAAPGRGSAAQGQAERRVATYFQADESGTKRTYAEGFCLVVPVFDVNSGEFSFGAGYTNCHH